MGSSRVKTPNVRTNIQLYSNAKVQMGTSRKEDMVRGIWAIRQSSFEMEATKEKVRCSNRRWPNMGPRALA